MKYLCLVYVEEKILNAMSQNERVGISTDAMTYCDTLQKQGQLIAPRLFIRRRQLRPCGSAMAKRRRPTVRLLKRRGNWAGSC